MRWGKKSKRIGIGSAAVATLAGTAMLLTDEHGISRAIAALADPLSVMTDRSPGARGAGAHFQTKLIQTKPALAVADPRSRGFVPTERVLPGIRTRTPALASAAPPVGFAPGPTGPVAAAVGSGLIGPAGFGGPPGLSTIGPGGGGGGGGILCPDGSTAPECLVTPPGPGPGPDPGDPTTPVPEPATWIMLIAGFLSMGAMMRRRPIGVRGAVPR